MVAFVTVVTSIMRFSKPASNRAAELTLEVPMLHAMTRTLVLLIAGGTLRRHLTALTTDQLLGLDLAVQSIVLRRKNAPKIRQFAFIAHVELAFVQSQFL